MIKPIYTVALGFLFASRCLGAGIPTGTGSMQATTTPTSDVLAKAKGNAIPHGYIEVPFNQCEPICEDPDQHGHDPKCTPFDSDILMGRRGHIIQVFDYPADWAPPCRFAGFNEHPCTPIQQQVPFNYQYNMIGARCIVPPGGDPKDSYGPGRPRKFIAVGKPNVTDVTDVPDIPDGYVANPMGHCLPVCAEPNSHGYDSHCTPFAFNEPADRNGDIIQIFDYPEDWDPPCTTMNPDSTVACTPIEGAVPIGYEGHVIGARCLFPKDSPLDGDTAGFPATTTPSIYSTWSLPTSSPAPKHLQTATIV